MTVVYGVYHPSGSRWKGVQVEIDFKHFWVLGKDELIFYYHQMVVALDCIIRFAIVVNGTRILSNIQCQNRNIS